MLRNILAAILGYIVIVIVVMLGIGIAWGFLGGAGAFRGESSTPSTPWMLLNLAFGFVAAVAGGSVARAVGKSAIAVKILATAVLVLGLLLAAMGQWGPAPELPPLNKPVAELSFTEAGQHAQPPSWYNWTVPFLGFFGALLGGRRRESA